MRVLIVRNENSDAVLAAKTIGEWLDARGIEHVVTSKHTPAPPDTAASDGTGEVGYDLAITLGGDGTILRCANLLGFSGVPILGFDFGTLGFLTGVTASDLATPIADALDGKLVAQRRATLKIGIELEDGSRVDHFGLNEVAVTHGPSGAIVDFDLLIDGVHVAHLRGDGMVVATATGSTAYSLSAGGPLVAPGHAGMIVTPISPHTLSARAIVTGPSDVVVLEPQMSNGEFVGVHTDGILFDAPSRPVRVTVQRGPGDVILLGKDGERFFADIASVFFNGSGRAGVLGYGAGQEEGARNA